MSRIVDIRGRQIIDSRGNPTVEAEVVLRFRHRRPRGGALGRLHRLARGGGAARRRCQALRRQGRAQGRGARQWRRCATCSSGFDAQDQRGLDAKMIEADGTDNKSNLGANAILAVSLAAAHAAARDEGLPLYRHLGGAGDLTLPVPQMNIINGGAHADNSVDIQEFMILPIGAPSLLRSGALRRRGVPRPEEGAARQGAQHRGGRRGRLRARPAVERGRAHRRSWKPSTRPAIGRARTSIWAWMSPARSSTRTACTSSSPRGASSARPSSPIIWRGWSPSIRSSPSRTA